ncbi:hypothetical protein [Streptomyces sp. NBC_01187]|nr:hypothetical protein OIE63_18770 [Streptomyces sp. NBC_01795]WSB81961.1 hypothetical protein OHB04_19600 [Streptomyces sp. NBC_01775]WSS17930.1 hypothetical protein OG533_20445 [Streptomyces sp. NBC_01186]WSS46679.1 hypothetical protein OG220_21150 [Streptomyces sp. NBC_01187]
MDLTPYVETLRQELTVAAGAGGEKERAVAERLAGAGTRTPPGTTASR